MKSFLLSYSITILFLILGAGIAFWAIAPLYALRIVTVVAPTPRFLTLLNNNQVTSLDIWQPQLSILGVATEKKPDITAKAALVFDLKTQKVTYEQNATQTLPMASLTKIMTAIIALENRRKPDTYLVTKANLVGENTMGLSEGEVLSLEELLYGMMLHSGNDAAETIASNYLGGRQAFIRAMNDKALALGLTHTHFTNPTGLQGDGNQHTTAYDLMVITRYAIQNFPEFTKVASTVNYTIPFSKTHKTFYLSNETNLLTTYPGVKGVKTGYTPEAALCLVTYLDYSGHTIIAVLLGSNNRRQDMRELLDYSLKNLGVVPPKFKGA